MTQNTNLNVSPYFDDFSESKNYKKVLFKPGFPVQSRELTTLQSILQNQIEKFGQYFFKEGSMVIPGGVSFDISYFAVKLDPFFLNIPVKEYTKVLADGGIKIKGETSGVTAVVVDRLTETESIDDVDTLYVKYLSNGTDGVQNKFADGENLITLSDINFSISNIEANSTFAKCIDTNSTATGSSASISDGVYFIRGYFVNVLKSTVILDQYTNSPSYKVGLSIQEEIVSASKANSDLFDNAKGFANESAPGADRFKISTTLIKKDLKDTSDQNFIELIRVKNGVLEKFVDRTDFNIFERELARRTFDESGDYYTKPFALDIRESLNDRISNRGLYFENEITQNGNTPSDEIYTIQVSPGKAYVRGYEIDKIGTTGIDSLKPRTTRKKEQQFLPVNAGNIVTLESVSGAPTIGFDSTYRVDLYDRRLQGVGAASTIPAGSKLIGYARAYDFNQKFNVGIATDKHDLRLYDIQTFTEITLDSKISADANDYVKGKFSGSVGFLKSAVSDDVNLMLYNTKGNFQVNEPLEINGINIGTNVGVSTDFEFSDVKSVFTTVGLSTFKGNTELSGEIRAFNLGDEFNVGAPSGSGLNQTATMTCGGVADFRNLVKIGDIISYVSSGTSNLPHFNRVDDVAKDSIILFATESVEGISNGTVVETSPNSPKIVVPQLREGNFPGYKLPIKNQYISSVNLLRSDYFVRKQIDLPATNSINVTFNIADLGDNDLTFEPFTERDYTLEWEDGPREIIRPVQTSFNAARTTFTINGLSKVDTKAKLTFLAKRNKLTSKDKTITRCNSIIVDKSKFAGAGAGSTETTFLDGLTFSKVYGTRVQDEEISLNFPDIHRVLAVFESNDAGPVQLPSITVSSQSDTFTNNVVAGEQFVGNDSGAVARVFNVAGGQQLRFVYENDKVFEIGENITLKDSGIVGQISAIIIGDRNLISNYELDDGQRLEFVDYGRIVRKKNVNPPTRKIQIVFDNYVNDESSGTVETVNSYNGLNYSKEIPSIGETRATDFIDYRPRVVSYSGSSAESANISPFSFLSRVFTGTSSETLVSNKTVKLDYNYYLGRIDRLYLTKNGVFELKKGEPSEFPKAPLPNNEAFEVALISMSPYTINATLNSQVKLIPHKRYTMKDIGNLEGRIKNLEEYTTLNLLETDTNNLAIKDPNTGLDKFKSGFFVDNFRNHASHNLTGDSNFDIDLSRGELRPRTTERNASLGFETKSTKSSPTTADYSIVDDFASPNITRNGSVLTLNFDEVEFINQPDATRVENVNPFLITTYVGSIELNPATDFWIEEVPLETPDIVQIDSIYNGLADVFGVGENGGMARSIFNSSETTWTGVETVVGEEAINRQVHVQDFGNEIVTTSSHDIRQTIEEKGIEKTFGLEVTAKNEQFSLGERVIDINVLYNVRSRNIEVIGKKLKPNTRYFVFMENVNLTGFCIPKLLPITMVKGSFATGDIVESSKSVQVLGQPEIKFRVAQANHKFGAFNSPTSTFPTEPYNNSSLTSAYSSTSTTLNVDTSDLADFVKPDRIGYVIPKMDLVNSDGSAEAEVDSIKLISDEGGNLIFSLHIPDPKIASNHKFTTGANTIRLTTSPNNDLNLLPGEVSAETVYNATGFSQTTQEQILSFKTAEVDKVQTGEQTVTRISENIIEDIVTVTREEVDDGDPLAQSFFVPRKRKLEDGTIVSSDGIFITGGEIFVRTKDDTIPLNISIRTMQNGTPTKTIVPFGEVDIDPTQLDSSGESIIKTSEDGSIGTKFTFKSPVYLQSDYEYALILYAPTAAYNVFISRMGEVDLLTQKLNDKQPTLGSLFKSQNASTWTPSQYEDLKFKLNKAKFVTSSSGSILLHNTDLPLGKILKENPIESFSQTQLVSIASTTREFTLGDRIDQVNGSITDTGRVSAIGGPVTSGAQKYATGHPLADVGVGATSLTSITGSGIGITEGVFTGIAFTALTGFGNTVTGTVHITSANQVGVITVTDGGNGFAAGDVIIANSVGNSGSAVRAVVGVVSTTDLVVIDNITRPFQESIALTHFNSSGSSEEVSGPTSIANDQIKDGFTLKINHENHGMHSNQNKVEIVDFQSNVSPVLLSDAIDDDTTDFVVSNIGILTSFEGSPVSAANTGYLKIGKEIISYESFNDVTRQVTIKDRGIDSSLKSNHKQNDLVSTYEFNEVSLLKINKTHNIDPREKTFDSYFIKLDDTNKSFRNSMRGGGKNLKISQNVPFEIINPQVTSILPTGASLSGRIKTTSGTSISGSEPSFNDEGFTNIALNKNNELDTPRIIASQVNEFNLLGNERSFALELTLKSNNEDISPFIDLSRLNVILHSNLVDQPVDNFETNNQIRFSGLDPHHGVYETKKIDLEFPSNGLFVKFDGHRDEEADIKVLFKLFRNDSSNDGQIYTPFNIDGSSDKFVKPNIKTNSFSEYKFTANNLPQFNGFMIKVIMTSTNQAKPPRIKNFRSIALRSFQGEE